MQDSSSGMPCLRRRLEELEAELSVTKARLAAALQKARADEAAQQQLVAIVEASRDAIWSWTSDGIIRSWNGEAERLLQYRADEIVGKSLLVLVPPERMAAAGQAIARLREGGWYEQYETIRVRKDGVPVPVELTVSPIRDSAGVVIAIATICRDITSRKRFEQALRESEALFSKVFQLAPIAIAISTLDEGRYLDVNAALLAATGYARDEVIGRTARELGVYADAADFARIRNLLATEGSLRGLDMRLRGKHGDIRTALLSGDIIDIQGKRCLLTASVDITERKAVEAGLADSEARYRTLVENANDIVAALDLEFRFVSVNPAVERVLGYAPHEILGTPLSRYVPPDQLSMHEAMLKRKLAGEQSTQYEMQLLAKDGQKRFTLEVNSKLMLGSDGRPAGIHSIARDITERREAEMRQQVLLRELQHRTKNMLAVIQSIATNTLSRSTDVKSALDAFTGRLHALAHAQEFVAAGPGAGVQLEQLVHAELEAFAARATIDGEPLLVGGAFAQTFALIVHELATNAAKHGALSTPRGSVFVNWKFDGSGADAQLRFTWVERGGPPSKPPARSGLGMLLISSVGTPDIAFTGAGFQYVLTVPVREVTRGVGEKRE